ncbi:LamG-like jellyroll fold domain-containing protein [Actinomadura alba]|uniref:Laminin G domain-containing protein n=1 Tax=Actinomadura alba TaxID=406431 RepID=A0ABR7LV86_9ACTN|nr:LamG domain-containing protein [Actinomadura alba]MBC6468758.1 hypothetical protein [Actinomadura alba]
MILRSIVGVGAVAMAGVLTFASAAHADNPVHLLYTFDECRTPVVDCASRIRDHSGHGNTGVVHAAVPGGALRTVAAGRGLGAHLSGALIRLDSTADDEAFNPGTRSFTYGAKVKMDTAFTTDANFLQRGRYSETTNQWKLQLDAGRQGCVVKGDQGRVMVFAPVDLVADGRWHTVACVVTPRSITYVVDGRTHSAPNTTGSVTFADTELLHVGGVFNADGTINDPFPAPFDDVFFGTWGD